MRNDVKCRQAQDKLELFLEEELPLEERWEVEAHLAECEECTVVWGQRREEMRCLGQLLRMPIEQAAQEVSFAGLWERIEAGLQSSVVDKERVVVEEPKGWVEQWRELFVGYRTAWIAVACAVCVLLVLAIPMLDPGPDANDCVVDEAIGGKSAQVAVLQTQNRATGKRMTVIVVDETTTDPVEDDPEDKPR